MRFHVLPSVIAIASFIWIIMVIQRWWFKFHDPSQFLLGLLIGLIGIFGSYLWNWMKNKDEEDREQTKRLNAVVDFWMNREKEANLQVAYGGENE